MNLKLLIALAAGVGALVGPQPQLKKVQSRSFAPATLDVCDDIEMRVDVIIEGKFHHRFYKCHDAWERRLKNKRLERDALNRENGGRFAFEGRRVDGAERRVDHAEGEH